MLVTSLAKLGSINKTFNGIIYLITKSMQSYAFN